MKIHVAGKNLKGEMGKLQGVKRLKTSVPVGNKLLTNIHSRLCSLGKKSGRWEMNEMCNIYPSRYFDCKNMIFFPILD